jgi:hypothetical protein
MNIILAQRIDYESGYEDIPFQLYHFPKRYRNQIRCGDMFIYYQGDMGAESSSAGFVLPKPLYTSGRAGFRASRHHPMARIQRIDFHFPDYAAWLLTSRKNSSEHST